MNHLPIVVTIAGSDSCGGAGIQADLKAFSAYQVYGMSVVTSVVSEIPNVVEQIENVSVSMVASQMDLLLRSYPVAAVKSGMLPTREIIEQVADIWLRRGSRPPLVVDPVMISGGGRALISEEACVVMSKVWLPLASLVTPNVHELQVLTDRSVTGLAGQRDGAKALSDRLGVAVLAKGGHIDSGEAVDVLWSGSEFFEFRKPWIQGGGLHGTGCTLSAAIAAGVALGLPLEEAVGAAKEFLHAALLDRLRWNGLEALNPFVEL